MVKVINNKFPRMDKLIAIFVVKVIMMFFYFMGFLNETRRVMRGWG
jgi:hypothetical protein